MTIQFTNWDGHSIPGMYNDMPEREYHSLQSMCSATQLKMLRNGSPLHVHHWLSAKQDTPALRVGRAMHHLVLQPTSYNQFFAVAPNVDRRTKVGKEAFASFEQTTTASQTVLTAVESDLVHDMAAAVRQHHTANELLTSGYAEITVISECFGGAACRGRVDMLHEDGTIVDLKTTATLASPQDMQHVVWKHGYGLQMAFYRELMRCCGIEPPRVVIVAVEKKPPYGVACFELLPELLDLHLPMVNRLVAEWRDTIGQNRFTGWSEHVHPLTLPKWAMDELEIEAEMAATTGGVV